MGTPTEPEPVTVPRNPKAVLADAVSMLFQPTPVAVTVEPLVTTVAFQDWVIACPLPRVQVTVQRLTPSGPACTVTSPWYPPCQVPTTR